MVTAVHPWLPVLGVGTGWLLSVGHCSTRDTQQIKPGELWAGVMCCAFGEEAITNTSLDSQSPYVSVQNPSKSPFHLKYWICFPPAKPRAFYHPLCLDRPLKCSDSALLVSSVGQRTPDKASGSVRAGLLPSHLIVSWHTGTTLCWGHGWCLSIPFPWLSVSAH